MEEREGGCFFLFQGECWFHSTVGIQLLYPREKGRHGKTMGNLTIVQPT